MIRLTKLQLQSEISNLLKQENGLNEVLQMTLNAMMLSERNDFLLSEENLDNKGNGYRYAKAVGVGKQISLSIPRDRMGVFKPVVLALIKEQNAMMKELSFSLYSKGLTTIQIGEVMEQIYGRHYSSSSISNITKEFYGQMQSWRERSLDECYLIVYIDAIHIKVRRERVSSEAFYILLGLKEDYTREVIGIVSIPTESASGWEEVLKSLKDRGVIQVDLIVSDGLKGLDSAVHRVFKDSNIQKCVTHLKRGILNKVKPVHKQVIAEELRQVFDVTSQNDDLKSSLIRLKNMAERWGKYYLHIKKMPKKEDIGCYFTYLEYDYRIRNMIYTTNWIERLNKDFRRTLKIRNALPSIESALTLLSAVAMEKEEKCYKYPIHNFKFEERFEHAPPELL